MEFSSYFFQQLINDSDISLQEITSESLKEFFNQIIEERKEKTRELGKKILIDFLDYKEDQIDEELTYLVGKSKFFFSYHQNLLEHLLEVSIFSANFAYQLNLNTVEAKRAAFFHDIGKVVGQYSDHVIEGMKLANQFKLDSYIIETIQFHHNYDTNINNPYLSIVRSMDKLSAGRLGARPFQLEKTKERKEKMHSLLTGIDGISRVEFLAGGHIIKIFLNPEKFNWTSLEDFKKNVTKTVRETDLKYQYNYQFLLKLEFNDSFLLDDY
ncbi:2\',3\'-cyclic-nucleotide 2\'-phosphodiesterase, probable 5\'-end truncated [Mycoplasma suis KI3806]|uniref:2\',3\'-cyclic-nucleotide 2\'-phosphodiesterase, probable 5\'-end truncated n=1 Tax=Mycoplasma suis (strain KI_3806) TaxID=708248 RepID=F0V3A2_MYCS3|nr:HDIG domain-containing metalloprotein [Mycoplasma suis]CBZ40324.1 2\',3\'-cyclic-nucleotide 2\'-phosphodiesterase, probable 5\'-end truncated [Mycoplasma suis KI3806]